MNFANEPWMDTTPNDWCAVDENHNLIDRDDNLMELVKRVGRNVLFVRNWWRPLNKVDTNT